MARHRQASKGRTAGTFSRFHNCGFGAYDGSFALSYFRAWDAQGFAPAVQYYQIFGEAGGGGGESAMLQKVQNATTMRSYYGDFKFLMQRAKDFGKPILLEGDGFGFLQQQSGGNSSALAAIASTGMPELAGLPNTVAGFGVAFLQIRKAVGATNAVLGIHISAWASGKDISTFNVTDALQPEVDKVYGFLKPFGLTANVSGAEFDVLVGDPLDRDADFYRPTQDQDRWWDASDILPFRRRASTVTPNGSGVRTRRRKSAGCSGRYRLSTPTPRT